MMLSILNLALTASLISLGSSSPVAQDDKGNPARSGPQVNGSCWQPLHGIGGSCWQQPDVNGSCWQPLNGSCWAQPDVNGSCWLRREVKESEAEQVTWTPVLLAWLESNDMQKDALCLQVDSPNSYNGTSIGASIGV